MRWGALGVEAASILVATGVLAAAAKRRSSVLPVAFAVGIDPVHLGIVFVLNLMIGLLTPPVGMELGYVPIVTHQKDAKAP